MKTCSKCLISKEEVEFYTNQWWCKLCHLSYYKAKSYSKRGKRKQKREDTKDGVRECNKCRIAKEVVCFPKNKVCSGGYERTCKQCVYAGREKNKEKNKEIKRKCYEKRREYYLIKAQEYYWNHLEEKRAYGRQHAKEHPEIYRAAYHRRRARIQTNGRNTLTAKDIKRILKENSFCNYCKTTSKLTLDHMIPIARGGENIPENIQVLCSFCNSTKRTKTHEEFVEYLLDYHLERMAVMRGSVLSEMLSSFDKEMASC